MITATVSGRVFEKLDRLPESLRSQLRSRIPDLTRALAERVRSKLAPGTLFKTTTHLLPAIKSQMVENAAEIYGRVYVDPSMFKPVVAHTLESGSRAHVITARNAPALSFFWEKLGRRVSFRSVNHPGFVGRSYMQSSLDEMKAEITAGLEQSVIEAWNRAG